MKRLVIFLLVGFYVNPISAQTPIKNYLYIGDKEKYVLSEKIRLVNDTSQTFNSLFVWQKDKVIRIVFKYIKKVPNTSKIDIEKLQTFNSFIPPFKKYTIYTPVPRMTTSTEVAVYHGRITYLQHSEDNSASYTILLKTALNNWNKKHNPLADRLAAINISDGNPYVLLKNEKRKEEYINNLPLMFNSSNNDSLYLVKPYIINIYRLSPIHGSDTLPVKKLIRYKLYGSISLMEDSFPDSYHQDSSYGFESFINQNTLPYLYKLSGRSNTGPLVNFLSGFPMSDQNFYQRDWSEDQYKVEDAKSIPIHDTDPKRIAMIKRRDSIAAVRRDSIQQKQEADRKIYEADCYGHYQYCPECYHTAISKAERIKMHCPVKISSHSPNLDENWSYAFTADNRHYIKMEIQRVVNDFSPPLQHPEFTEDDYPTKWLLMSPGIGFWMTDVARDTRKYFMPDNSITRLFLNNKPVMP